MTNFSVNLNKVALLRNSRPKDFPSIEEAAILAIRCGCDGLTIHPRADERHARLVDVDGLAAICKGASRKIELNIEGNCRPALMARARAARADQFTLVPADPGELTSTRGWNPEKDDMNAVKAAVIELREHMRVSLFIEPDIAQVRLARELGTQCVEIYTGDYVNALSLGNAPRILEQIIGAAEHARAAGLRIHLGHDLDLANLSPLLQAVKPDEVSIGHAIAAEAMLVGLEARLPLYVRACHES
jgi:pyridoxine 5-phosphate synthase